MRDPSHRLPFDFGPVRTQKSVGSEENLLVNIIREMIEVYFKYLLH